MEFSNCSWYYFSNTSSVGDKRVKLKWVNGRGMQAMDQSILEKRALFDQYAEYITPERKAKLIENASQRTRHVTVVLEDIYQSHNMSAVLRTSDCFGIQDIHIIEEKHHFTVTKEIVKGASQWLSLTRYLARDGQGTQRCFQDLRNEGYAIVATTPHAHDVLIDQLPITKKIALVFGTEKEGLSSYALEKADAFVKVPLYGFTESFNISVCAGIVLYELTKRMRESSVDWRLTEHEQLDLQLQWLAAITPFGRLIDQRLTELASQ
jgi:tRNA (guanosine-2'-O-)-methyltransferase